MRRRGGESSDAEDTAVDGVVPFAAFGDPFKRLRVGGAEDDDSCRTSLLCDGPDTAAFAVTVAVSAAKACIITSLAVDGAVTCVTASLSVGGAGDDDEVLSMAAFNQNSSADSTRQCSLLVAVGLSGAAL
jgi:hypothetical protein